jgi:hypothetical protein
VAAQARTVKVWIVEDRAGDQLVIRMADNGTGMEPELLAATQERFASTRAGRRKPIGLGLALLRQTAAMCDGDFTVLSRPGQGTLVEARMQHSHIDRPPLGDWVTTVLELVVGNPHVGFRFTHGVNGRRYTFDSRTVKRVLGSAELLQQPEVVRWIREELEKGERALQNQDGVVW